MMGTNFGEVTFSGRFIMGTNFREVAFSERFIYDGNKFRGSGI